MQPDGHRRELLPLRSPPLKGRIMELDKMARLGDCIETTVRQPTPATLRLKLDTPAACAYANQLLTNPAGGWRLIRSS